MKKTIVFSLVIAAAITVILLLPIKSKNDPVVSNNNNFTNQTTITKELDSTQLMDKADNSSTSKLKTDTVAITVKKTPTKVKSNDPKIKKARQKKIVEQAEYNFYIEDIDDNWSKSHEESLYRIFTNEVFSDSTLNSVTCRSVTCRASISSLTNQQSSKLPLKLIKRLEETSAFEFNHQPQLDGSILTIVYFKPVNFKKYDKN